MLDVLRASTSVNTVDIDGVLMFTDTIAILKQLRVFDCMRKYACYTCPEDTFERHAHFLYTRLALQHV